MNQSVEQLLSEEERTRLQQEISRRETEVLELSFQVKFFNL